MTSNRREIDDTALRIRNTETEHEKNHCAIPSHDASPKNRFSEFWDVWPSSNRKVAKAKCSEVWKRRKLDSIADTIISHISAMKETDQWRTGFEPAPMTYLNQQRWLDGGGEPFQPAQNWI